MRSCRFVAVVFMCVASVAAAQVNSDERPNDAGRNLDGYGNAFVSTSDLGIPSRARREFDKAYELIGKQEFDQAIQKLNKAVVIYPGYAGAYNNLGVLYAWRGDQARERESLEKAIRLNDHFALAYLNLGRLNIATGDFPAAESLLDKAATFDATDSMTLILLTWAQFQQEHLDAAIVTSRKAHRLGNPHAFVHWVAARALEKKNRGAEAAAELELYLQEEPAGPFGGAAREELQVVKARFSPR